MIKPTMIRILLQTMHTIMLMSDVRISGSKALESIGQNMVVISRRIRILGQITGGLVILFHLTY